MGVHFDWKAAGARRAAPIAALVTLLAIGACASLAGAVNSPAQAKPPAVSTGGASDVSESFAALNGVVNPHGLETSCYFQYGATPAYGEQTPASSIGAASAGVKVTQPLSGLALGATYHYRLVAVSSAGTTQGQDRTFTTKRIPLRFVITQAPKVANFGKSFTLSGTLSGTGGAGQQLSLQSDPFPYLGDFNAVGKATSTDSAGNFSMLVPGLSQTAELRVITAADALPTYSPVVTVRVAALVSLQVRPTRQPGLVRFSGTVRPAEAGAPVKFQLVRSSGAGATVATTTAHGGAAGLSRFGALVQLRRTGSYRALVQLTNGRQVSGYSRTVFAHGARVVVGKPHRAVRRARRRR